MIQKLRSIHWTGLRHTTNIAIAVLVAIHLAVALWHGNAHTELAIALPPGKNAFALIVILIAPLVAASLVWTPHVLVLWMFFPSMLGALLFGAYGAFCLGSRSPRLHDQAQNRTT